MKKLVKFLAEHLVDNPRSVNVTEEVQNGAVIVKLMVEKNDMGKIIGKNGRIIKSLRNILKIKAIKMGKKAFLQLQDQSVNG